MLRFFTEECYVETIMDILFLVSLGFLCVGVLMTGVGIINILASRRWSPWGSAFRDGAFCTCIGLLFMSLAFGFVYTHGARERRKQAAQQSAVVPVMEQCELAACKDAGYVKPHWKISEVRGRTYGESWTFQCVDARGGLHETLPPECNTSRLHDTRYGSRWDEKIGPAAAACGVTLPDDY